MPHLASNAHFLYFWYGKQFQGRQQYKMIQQTGISSLHPFATSILHLKTHLKPLRV